MDVFTLAMLAALVVKIMTVIKSVGKDNNMALTQVITWVVGVLSVAVAGQSSIGAGVAVFGTTLGDMNLGDAVLIGMSISSTGSLAYDFKKPRAPEPSLAPALDPNS